LDREAFATVDRMVGAFVQTAFGKLLPTVMAGFFGPARGPDELRNPELQAAFMLFFVYGWKDPHGMRIIDAFAEYGPKVHGEERRVLDALRRARMSLFRMERRADETKQLRGVDLLRETEMTVLDHNAFETLEAKDALLAWYIEIGAMWRPFGVATHVPASKVAGLRAALVRLADSLDVSLAQLPERMPAQTFWTVFRVTNLEIAPG